MCPGPVAGSCRHHHKIVEGSGEVAKGKEPGARSQKVAVTYLPFLLMASGFWLLPLLAPSPIRTRDAEQRSASLTQFRSRPRTPGFNQPRAARATGASYFAS